MFSINITSDADIDIIYGIDYDFSEDAVSCITSAPSKGDSDGQD